MQVMNPKQMTNHGFICAAVQTTPCLLPCLRPARALHLQGRCAVYASVSSPASEPASEASTSGRSLMVQKPHKLRFNYDTDGVNWTRWELRLLQAAIAKADQDAKNQDPAEAAALAALASTAGPGSQASSSSSSGSSSGSSAYRHWDNPAAHEALVTDTALQAAWRSAFAAGADHMKDKVVLDLGCGTGQLALMAAQAGAKHVYAVDASEGAAESARRAAKANGFADRITVITGLVQSISLPEKVDVIVSNWAGPGLLAGGMFGALALARKKFLKPDGLVLPDQVSLMAVGVEDREALAAGKDTWARAAGPGLDMSSVMTQVVRFPRLDRLTRRTQLVTEPAQVAAWQLDQLTPAKVFGGGSTEDGTLMYYNSPLSLKAIRDERMFGIMLYFDLAWTFGGSLEGSGKSPVRLSTGPAAPATHYQQLVVDFPKSLRVAPGDTVSINLACAPSESDPRDIDLQLSIEAGGAAANAQYHVMHTLVPAAVKGF